MRLLIERVKSAKCLIDKEIYSKIANGLLVYVAFEDSDTTLTIEKAIRKLLALRIFSDENAKMNLSIKDTSGSILLISSFSLYASLSNGNRPSFVRSSKSEISKPLYQKTIELLAKEIKLKTGEFGAEMLIEAENDGPVSIIMDIE